MKRPCNKTNTRRRTPSGYRSIAVWIFLVLPIAGCAKSHKADKPTDSVDIDWAFDHKESSVDGFDGNASLDSNGLATDESFDSDASLDIESGKLNTEKDSAIDWTDNLHQLINARLDAETEPEDPKIQIKTPQSGEVPIGQWLGQTAAGQYQDCIKSKRVEMQIVPSENQDIYFGVVIFGDSDPPPTVVDPDIEYPPGLFDMGGYEPCLFQSPVDGFLYTIRDGRVDESGRFIFRIAFLEVFKTWCALQTRYNIDPGPLSEPIYSCAPPLDEDEGEGCNNLANAGSYFRSDNRSWYMQKFGCPIDASKVIMCGFGDAPCQCNQQGCAVSMNRTIQFDLTFDDETMQGVITNVYPGVSLAPLEVRLRRVQ